MSRADSMIFDGHKFRRAPSHRFRQAGPNNPDDKDLSGNPRSAGYVMFYKVSKKNGEWVKNDQ